MPTLHWLTRDDDLRAASRVPYRRLDVIEDSGKIEGNGWDEQTSLIETPLLRERHWILDQKMSRMTERAQAKRIE